MDTNEIPKGNEALASKLLHLRELYAETLSSPWVSAYGVIPDNIVNQVIDLMHAAPKLLDTIDRLMAENEEQRERLEHCNNG